MRSLLDKLAFPVFYMAEVILISPDIVIKAERPVADGLIAGIRPFIAEVAAGIRNRLSLSESIHRAAEIYPELIKHFVLQGDLSTFGIKHDLLFPENDNISGMNFHNCVSGKRLQLQNLREEELCEIANILRLLGTTHAPNELAGSLRYPEILRALAQIGIYTDDTRASRWKISEAGAGILRMQHASFLLHSSKARILVDPHFVSGYSSFLSAESRMLPGDFNSFVDAVLITHSHADHYHLPSLMILPRDVTMIVPKVPAPSIVCPNMAGDLRAIGFRNVLEPDWYSGPVVIEDIEIWPLPFFGEQPLRYEAARHEGLRNWGNTYLFRTPHFSAWCLIDSGADARGSMTDVARIVKERFGGADVVLSNLQEFYVGVHSGNPFYITGRGHYWLSLTADQIQRFPDMRDHLITLGVNGVAEICALLQAKTFLPYSHLWAEIGQIPERESSMLAALSAESSFYKAGTKIETWRIGDQWTAPL